MNKVYYFISDIHLGLHQKDTEAEKEKVLVDFLKIAQSNCDELFIVGDLFDYWFEYKRVYQKGYYRTLTALKDLSESGVKIHYFIGNHDFLHRDFFETEFNAKLYHNPLSIELNRKKFFIGHGDGMVENDTGFKREKKIRWKCSKCGYIHEDTEPPEKCPSCKHAREYYEPACMCFEECCECCGGEKNDSTS